MITFRNTKQSFEKNTFFTKKTTPICNTLNSFGYLKYIDKRGFAIVDWYDNYNKAELKFKIKELQDKYKSIYPYYNTPTVRGNIWKHSYTTLLQYINKDTGFSKIKVDKVTYKISPIKGNNVIICDARFVLENNITILEGKIKRIIKNVYTIITSEGEFVMGRNCFSILPQDYFILLSIRCKQ